MTTHAAPLLALREQLEIVRVRRFAVLMMAAGVCGALAGVFDHPGEFALVLVMPAYVISTEMPPSIMAISFDFVRASVEHGRSIYDSDFLDSLFDQDS